MEWASVGCRLTELKKGATEMFDAKRGVELFYSCGGHGGPYDDRGSQRRGRSTLVGMPTMAWVDIVERDPIAIGWFGHRLERISPSQRQCVYWAGRFWPALLSLEWSER